MKPNVKNILTIVKWLGDNRGDNLAFRYGQRIYMVDKYGVINSKRYKRAETRPVSNLTCNTTLEGLTDFKIGYTYTILQSELAIGKLTELNLFGYRFMSITPEGQVTFVGIDYDDAMKLLRAGNIKQVKEKVC